MWAQWLTLAWKDVAVILAEYWHAKCEDETELHVERLKRDNDCGKIEWLVGSGSQKLSCWKLVNRLHHGNIDRSRRDCAFWTFITDIMSDIKCAMAILSKAIESIRLSPIKLAFLEEMASVCHWGLHFHAACQGGSLAAPPWRFNWH